MINKTGSRRSKAQTAQVEFAQQAAEAVVPGAAPVRKTKASLLRDLLSAPGGASLQTLMQATDWQAHTVRASLSGLRKSGVTLIRTPDDAGPTYAIVAAGEAPPEKPDAGPAPPQSRKKATKAATKQAESMIAADDSDAGGADATNAAAASASGLAALS